MIRLTTEQQEIVYAEENEIYVKAKAGTGKTTTLTEFVRYRKSETFLYIVYNSSLRQEAQSKFPANTEVHNIHSLAYKHIGHKYKEQLCNDISNGDIFNSLDCFADKKIDDEETMKLLLDATKLLRRFFNSSAKSIEDVCINVDASAAIAQEYWSKMIDLKESSVAMTHEGYLKLFHLSEPILDYDYILVDEAQDSNEVMIDIVYSQKAKKVFVGDDDQKIYGFRGALSVFKDNQRASKSAGYYYLTTSFRFGKNIASISNKLLDTFKNKKDKKEKVVGFDKEDEITSIDKDFQYTIITRTNAHLFDKAYEFVNSNKKVHILGFRSFAFNDIRDIYYLYSSQKDLIKGEFVKSTKNFESLKSIVKYAKMTEMSYLIKVVEKYANNTLNALDKIEKSLCSEKNADVILTTVHKSKGLEFADVLLAEDFIPLFDESGKKIPKEQVDEEEINLYYVAVTRTMYTLELNSQLKLLQGAA